MSNISLSPIGVQDVSSIALVHCESFSDRALTMIGGETVQRYYESQLASTQGVHGIGAFDGEKMVGFCVCGLTGNAFGKFFSRHKSYIVRRLLSRPWLFFKPIIRQQVLKALAILCGGGSKANQNGPSAPVFRVLAIGVSPDAQRKGVGAALMNAAQEIAIEDGYTEIGLSVHPENTKALRFYEHQGWQRITAPGSEWTGSMMKRLN